MDSETSSYEPVDLSRSEGHTPNWRVKVAFLDDEVATLIEGHGPHGDHDIALFSDPETPEEFANEALLLDAPALRAEVIALRAEVARLRALLHPSGEGAAPEIDVSTLDPERVALARKQLADGDFITIGDTPKCLEVEDGK